MRGWVNWNDVGGRQRPDSRAFSRGKALLAVVVATIGLANASAAVTVHSSSGQFVVHSPYPTTPSLGQLVRQPEGGVITLQPDPLAVGAERVKAALLRELGLKDQWQGRVQVKIRPDLSQASARPIIVATRFTDGWLYTLELPEQIRRDVLLRLLVQVVFIELANRSQGTYPPELPVWLIEGMAERLQSRVGPDLIPEQTPLLAKIGDQIGRLPPMVRDQLGFGEIEALRAWLREHPPLSFNDLALLTPGSEGDALKTYRASARLFVDALLELPRGKSALVIMLSLLPRRLNWQTAFLEAYRSYFPTLLAVEQWWALVAVQFLTGTEPHSWSPAFTRRKLDDILHVVVDRRSFSDERLVRTRVSLQEIIRETSYPSHRELIRSRITQLQLLENHAAQELVPLIRQYASVLREYLAYRRGSTGGGTRAAALLATPEAAARQTILKLDELDRKRASMVDESPNPAGSKAAGDTGTTP